MRSQFIRPRLAIPTLLFLAFSSLPITRAGTEQALPALLKDVEAEASPNFPPRDQLGPIYEPTFSAFDKSITGRQTPEGNIVITELQDGLSVPMNVENGTTQRFRVSVSNLPARELEVLEEGRLELRSEHNVSEGSDPVQNEERQAGEEEAARPKLAKRQNPRTILISANTCEQPRASNASSTTSQPPQLTMYVSTDPSNKLPGPRQNSAGQVVIPFVEGAVMYNLTTRNDVYIGVHAPNVSDVFGGVHAIRIAASTEKWFYSYDTSERTSLILVDRDSQSVLLQTHDLTDGSDPQVEAKLTELMKSQTYPYIMFAHPANDSSIKGLKNSYCALQTFAQIALARNGQPTTQVTTSLTKRGPGHLLKQQFSFDELKPSTEYIAILARDGGTTTGLNKRQDSLQGGGQVFRSMTFTTKSDHGNCGLISGLDFCDQVAYSVPSNRNNSKYANSTALAKFYDEYASSMYKNFLKSLDQIQCDAHPSQKYSHARNCTDCRDAYKEWLCSVTIPRCEDISSTEPYLQPRAVRDPFPDGETLSEEELKQFPTTSGFLSSRNPMIDEEIKPGPYKEMLPCDDLCYKLVQSCPAALGFGCPLPGHIGFNQSYGTRAPNGALTCNFQGSAYFDAGAGRLGEASLRILGRAVGFASLAALMGVLV